MEISFETLLAVAITLQHPLPPERFPNTLTLVISEIQQRAISIHHALL